MDVVGRVSFLGRRVPPRFEIRTVTLPPGHERAFHEADWLDALVVIERGRIELVSEDGSAYRFASGDVISLAGLGLRAIRNEGGEPAVLAGVARRARPACAPG
jgi:quercetin dioxygenase-like cupin family protein